MLIGAYSVLLKTPGRFFGGDVAQMPAAWGTSGANRNRFVGWAGFDPHSATPVGYAPGYGWVPAIKAGSLSTFDLVGEGTLTAAPSGGVDRASAMTGAGSLAAEVVGLAYCVAALSGAATVTGDSIGVGQMVAPITGLGALAATVTAGAAAIAALSGSGDLSGLASAAAFLQGALTGDGAITASAEGLAHLVAAATGSGSLTAIGLATAQGQAALSGSGALVASLTAIGHLVADLTGVGSVNASSRAEAHMSADITASGDVAQLTEAGIAAAVWEMLAAGMATGTMGDALVRLYELAGLDPTKPLVVTSTTRTAGDLEQTIAEAAGTVTVTRT